jgi:hypothetical protein
MGQSIKNGLNHRPGHRCIQKTLETPFFAQVLSKTSIQCIQRDKPSPAATIEALEETTPMDLQFLEFDCSEDSEGVVCWDALAQPAARHTPALLQEVTQLLAWAHRFGPQAPGPIEDGADWDFDLHIRCGNAPITAHWHSAKQTLALSSAPSDEITLSLSISGTPTFAQAFREHWNAP